MYSITVLLPAGQKSFLTYGVYTVLVNPINDVNIGLVISSIILTYWLHS